jgi:2-keto-3-deoxy-L-rhamnonate aldolase RhmA
MKANRVKQLLREGKSTCGTWVSLASPVGAEVMGMQGFDWLLIDMEHSPVDYQTLSNQMLALAPSESVPFVRVPWNDAAEIKRVLDLGAMGIMVPGISTLEDAKRAVAACKYPPEGIRGVASVRAARYGQDTNYLKEANGQVMVIAQIEMRDAVEDIERILDVPGIDCAFIGPADLSATLGHLGNASHPDVQAAIAKVEKAAKARRIPLGSVSTSWDVAKGLYDKGYQLVSVMSDIRFLFQASRGVLESFNKTTGRG